MNEEIYIELDRLTHLIKRVLASYSERRRKINSLIKQIDADMTKLQLAISEIYRIVELVSKEE